MRIWALTFLFLLPRFFIPVYGQRDRKIDSLLTLISAGKEDSIQLKRYLSVAGSYTLVKPDSNLHFANKAAMLAEKLGDTRRLAMSYRIMSSGFKILGDYPRAWEFLQKAKTIYREIGDEESVRFMSYAEATLNFTQGDYRDALKTFLQERMIRENASFSDSSSYYFDLYGVYTFIASAYIKLNKPDSGLYYSQLALDLIKNIKHPYFYSAYLARADAFSLFNQFDSALKYYKKGYPEAMIDRNAADISQAGVGLARLYLRTGQPDSAIKYARLSLDEAQSSSYREGMIKSAKLMAEIYEGVDLPEAIKYYKMASAIYDSVYGKQKLKQVENLKYSEELRRREVIEQEKENRAKLLRYLFIGGLSALGLIILLLVRNNIHKQHAKKKVEKAYNELRLTQSQLIQSEKMASLGELTAGIAHEIQNPLNFVNNFSEVNTELIDELEQEAEKGNLSDVKAIAKDIKENERKINHHGKRADAIVKGMLQHSRSSNGVKEPTDINALCDEYLRLAYHGLRAKEKSFNGKMETDFDETISNIDIIPQDIGRVVLNLINNAFYAVAGKDDPTVSISTKKINNAVEVRVKDNGNGIPQKVLDKIFQPFFTTKPTGEGTGLGLSLSYDIVKAHGGEIKVNTKENEGTTFIIQLPVNT